MYTIGQIAGKTGLSVRTLRYYDEIGLLTPSAATEAGYRLYEENDLRKLGQILLFRELEFPLAEIKSILASPDFDPASAVTEQIALLKLKKDRLDQLITFAEHIVDQGEYTMNFDAFDRKKIKDYEQKAKEKWGTTAAYAEYETKTKGKTDEEKTSAADGLMAIFAALGALRGETPESPAVQEKVKEIQDYITKNFYTCTGEILASLGQMYAAGDEMTENIDRAGGAGTAALAAKAIAYYCK